MPAQLFGRHVEHRAAHDIRIGFLEIGTRQRARAGEAEVEQLHVAVAAQHDVVRLDVAVHEADRFGGRQRRRDLDGDVEDLREWRFAAAHALAQRHAVDVFGGDEVTVADAPDVVDGEDVRMIERRRRARLVLEPFAQIVVVAHRVREHFQRDRAMQLRIVREIDLSHPAGADERADFVAAEEGAGLEQREDSNRVVVARLTIPSHVLT